MIADHDHRGRRERLLADLGTGLVLVRGAGNNGGTNPNFLYLTGLDEPRGALLLAGHGVRVGTGYRHPGPDYVRGRLAKQLLFLPEPDALARAWGEESAATSDRVTAGSVGVDEVVGASQLLATLGRALQSVSVLHYVRCASPSLVGGADEDALFVARIRERLFGLEIRDATPSLNERRRLKEPSEVAAIEQAVALTGAALERAVARIAPGVRECEIEGEITRCYRSAAASHAFPAIVATGSNAVLPHYRENTATLEAGQLVLIDTGASIEGYKGDVTRTYPVDGVFTEPQREVYESVLRAQRRAIELCMPGALLGDIHAAAFESIDADGYGKYFIHGTGHHLGLETHDVGDVQLPLEPGAVITVEPGIYMADEAIGVRIEDDVLITPQGQRVLSEAIASNVREIEERAG